MPPPLTDYLAVFWLRSQQRLTLKGGHFLSDDTFQRFLLRNDCTVLPGENLILLAIRQRHLYNRPVVVTAKQNLVLR